jgi:hypothetical protein
LDQNGDCLLIFLKHCHKMMNEPSYWQFYPVLILSLGSAIPNTAIAIRYANGPVFWQGLTITASGLSPFFVNSKWFYELLDNSYQYLAGSTLDLSFKRCLTRYCCSTNELPVTRWQTEINQRQEHAFRNKFNWNKAELLKTIEFMPIQQLRSLSIFSQKREESNQATDRTPLDSEKRNLFVSQNYSPLL